MPGEQDPSKFEAFKQGIAERFDGIKQSFNNAKAVGEIAAVGVGATLGLVGGAAIEQASTEPAHAANVPEATASSLDKTCINTGLAVKILKPAVTYAGIVGSQISGAGFEYKKMSTSCVQEGYKNTSEGMFQVKRPDQDHWRALGYHFKRIKFLPNTYFKNKQAGGLIEGTNVGDKQDSPKYIRPGECARVLVKNTVTLHNKPVASRQATKPAKVFDGNIRRAEATGTCFN